jgi:acetolactate synthase-1/2/3 large subunit
MAPDVPLVMPHPIEMPVAQDAALDRAADLILQAERPLVMLGAAASRPKLADALSQFVRRLRIPFFNTQMGKGAVAGGSNLYIGTAALSERDYVHQASHGNLSVSCPFMPSNSSTNSGGIASETTPVGSLTGA